jgi:hypothetical protein
VSAFLQKTLKKAEMEKDISDITNDDRLRIGDPGKRPFIVAPLCLSRYQTQAALQACRFLLAIHFRPRLTILSLRPDEEAMDRSVVVRVERGNTLIYGDMEVRKGDHLVVTHTRSDDQYLGVLASVNSHEVRTRPTTIVRGNGHGRIVI